MSKILVNAVGDACPIPVTKTIHALSGMTEAGTVEVHVDNETAVQNLNRLATGKGLKFSAEKREEKLFVVTLTVDDPAAVSGTAPEEAACTRITGTTPWMSSVPAASAPATTRWVPR